MIFSSIEKSLFADETVVLHSLDELPSSYMDNALVSAHVDEKEEITTSIMSLVQERSDYRFFNTKTTRTHLDAPDTRLQNFSVRKTEQIENTLDGMEKNPIKTNIQIGTIIREKNKTAINPSTIGIHEVSPTNRKKAVEQLEKEMEKRKRGFQVNAGTVDPITFEFGIEGQHLIFSKPVAISVDTPNMTDGIVVDILVLHAGDNDYNTSGLTTDPNATCNPDGTTSRPINTGVVRGGKVTFYTCGASSFTINPTGGVSGSNDLKLIIGDCGQFQLYYDGNNNIYGSTLNPPSSGCSSALDSWFALRIGTTTYWSESNNWTTKSTVGSQSGNTYNGTTTLSRTVSGKIYELILNWEYIAPNKYFTIDWEVNIPSGNSRNVIFYIGNDSMVGGNDANDVGYSGSLPSRTIGVYDNVLDQMSAIRYLSGITWTAAEVGPYGTIRNRISGGRNFADTIQTTSGDLGFGVNWNFGSTPGAYTGKIAWRVVPYTQENIPDVISGIGQPTPELQVGQISTIPITVTNVGNTSSTGIHTVVMTIPDNILGPLSTFSNNGWSCGVQIGSEVTCTKNMTLNLLGNDTVNIPVNPQIAASNTTARFLATVSNASESDTSNNGSYVDLQVSVAPPPVDTTAPTMLGTNVSDGSLIPSGNFIFSFSYFDDGSNIDITTPTTKIYSWNAGTSTWNTSDLAPTYATTLGVTTHTGTFQIQNLPFGKYRFDLTVKDNNGNTSNQSVTLFVDAVEWTISAPTYDIGGQQTDITGFGSGELLITVKTVGAGFDLTMQRTQDLTMENGTISVWNETNGWGYDLYNMNYSGNLTAHGTSQTLASVSKSINQSGQKNTYIYRVKYGMKASIMSSPGDYLGKLQFGINLNY
ncbi:MAG: hypothetical protein PHY14_02420 [Candidatus Gracilibacteria bacterium]|nr:hypothetical protein [Candidatus Gracilibacteria bacterium]